MHRFEASPGWHQKRQHGGGAEGQRHGAPPRKAGAPHGLAKGDGAGGQRAAEEQRERRHNGQDIRHQLEGTRREKKPKISPAQSRRKTVSSRSLPCAARASRSAHGPEEDPRQKAADQDGKEKPERLVAVVDLRRVAQEMLVDEVEPEELGVGPGHPDVPGESDGEEKRRTRRLEEQAQSAPGRRRASRPRRPAPGRTMPISPLVRTARAAAAQ